MALVEDPWQARLNRIPHSGSLRKKPWRSCDVQIEQRAPAFRQRNRLAGLPAALSESRLVRKADITAELVTGLIEDQFPQWADLAVRPVEADGIDNTTFRLGPTMSVRLPSADT